MKTTQLHSETVLRVEHEWVVMRVYTDTVPFKDLSDNELNNLLMRARTPMHVRAIKRILKERRK